MAIVLLKASWPWLSNSEPAVLIHVFPPVSEANTPSTLRRRLETSAYRIEGFFREIARLMRPHNSPFGRPSVRCFHFVPPSVLRQMPLTAPPASILAYRTFGSVG